MKINNAFYLTVIGHYFLAVYTVYITKHLFTGTSRKQYVSWPHTWLLLLPSSSFRGHKTQCFPVTVKKCLILHQQSSVDRAKGWVFFVMGYGDGLVTVLSMQQSVRDIFSCCKTFLTNHRKLLSGRRSAAALVRFCSNKLQLVAIILRVQNVVRQ